MGLISSAAQAQITTTETLNFDNNQLPSGWSWVNYNIGNNYQIVNQRMEVGQVDTSAGIYKSVDFSNATKVQIEYDGNIANVFWGQGVAAAIASDPLNLSASSLTVGMRKVGWGQNVMEFDSGWASSNLPGGGVNYYQNAMSPVFGNYHMSAIFENGQITQTVTNLDTGASFASGVVAIPGSLLSDMHSVVLWGTTTTGISAWIDNATISITTAVPEPETETCAMLLAGLGVLGAASRRKPKQIAVA